MLDFENWGHATQIAGGVSVGAAVAVDNTEKVGAVGTGRTLPPKGISGGTIMHIFNFAVSRCVIAVLF